ncbi:hypothetical protein [Rubidibacter lacunae]|uniref:hypothetical protein n=1 Tax=Rubidibacter lacunae TaxID=582514 RepID=UPI00058DEE76|nr:hypothetical protein [Rubidibacter lacunae]
MRDRSRINAQLLGSDRDRDVCALRSHRKPIACWECERSDPAPLVTREAKRTVCDRTSGWTSVLAGV